MADEIGNLTDKTTMDTIETVEPRWVKKLENWLKETFPEWEPKL